MKSTTGERVFRVTVRGQFGGLSDEARRYLTVAQAEHDIFVSAYTPEGTFTYDSRILFFNLRYELRSSAPDATADVTARGLHEAELFLRTMKFGHKNLRVTDVADSTAIWDDIAARG
jgi:hypothetical protein